MPTPDTQHAKHRFALIDLLMGVGIIAVLIALLLPMLVQAHQSARSARCQSHLRELGSVYRKVERKQTPTQFRAATIRAQLGQYVPRELWQCPNEAPDRVSYGFNARMHRLHDQDAYRIVTLDYRKQVADVVGPPGPRDDWPTACAPRHAGRCNVLFYDGHVEPQTPESVDPRNCEIHERHWRPAIDTMNSRSAEPGCAGSATAVP